MNTLRHGSLLRSKRQGKVTGMGPPHECEQARERANTLKGRLVRRLAAEGGGRVPEPIFRQATAEAEALAWSTSYPLLFLPVLMEEKVEGARRWANRQREVLERQKALAIAV